MGFIVGEIGKYSIWLSLFLAVYGIFSYLYGYYKQTHKWMLSGRTTAICLAASTSLAIASLQYLLLTSNFNFWYVVKYTSSDLDLFYKITALWAGNAGSLLLWLWVLSLFALMVALSKHKDSDIFIPHVMPAIYFVTTFFAGVLVFTTPPFEVLAVPPEEGNGLNPLLQNPGMAIHPITLYFGYIGFTVPFAYAIAALWLKRTDAVWLYVTRRWTVLSWLFLALGIIYGGKWGYEELGFGGYWVWDPVENASFIPWLTATAYLHSAIVQEKKGMLKRWNVILIILTFLLTIFGTFLTRSGVLWSVHAFANGPIGAILLGFIGVLFMLSLALLLARWNSLHSDKKIEAVASKESSFMLNNLLLLGAAFTVFWGTVFPLVSEIITGNKLMVGPPFYNSVYVPIAIATIFLMGIGPLIAWRKASLQNLKRNFTFPLLLSVFTGVILFILGIREWIPLLSLISASFVIGTLLLEFYRGVLARQKLTGESVGKAFFNMIGQNRRRYGGYIVHLAVVIIAIGITASSAYPVEVQKTLEPGQSLTIKQYKVTYLGLWEQEKERYTRTFVDLKVEPKSGSAFILRPERFFYETGDAPKTAVSIKSTWTHDLFSTFVGWVEGTGQVVVKIKLLPFVSWIWFGGYLMIFGTLIAVWPEKKRKEELA